MKQVGVIGAGVMGEALIAALIAYGTSPDSIVISEKRKVWEDMLEVMEKIGLPISARQRGYFLNP